MRSKAEIIAGTLDGLKVLDVGGSGYGEENAYELELRNVWARTAKRTIVDFYGTPDIRIDLDSGTYPDIEDPYDITTAFDVLEHLEKPVELLRWIPTPRLLVTLPNACSWFARKMERDNQSDHLFSFVEYTAMFFLERGGWTVDRIEYQFGKWSPVARIINTLGSIYPPAVGTGIVLHCTRKGHN